MKHLGHPLFENFAAEIGRNNLTKAKVAKRSGIKYQSFLNKYNGKTEFLRSELISIRDSCFPGLTLEYLFKEFSDAS